MAKGIIGTVQLAVTLAFALPLALFGLSFIGQGRTLMGLAGIAIAVLMVVLEEYLTTPGDLPGKVAEKAVGAVAKEPDDEE